MSGSFRGRFGDHYRVGDHFGVGIISGAVQYWHENIEPHWLTLFANGFSVPPMSWLPLFTDSFAHVTNDKNLHAARRLPPPLDRNVGEVKCFLNNRNVCKRNEKNCRDVEFSRRQKLGESRKFHSIA